MASYQVEIALRQGLEECCKELAQEIQEYSYAYWVLGAPTASDEKYDALVAKLRKLDPEHPVLVNRLPPDDGISAHPITDYLPSDVVSKVPWSFSFGDAAYTIVTVQAVLDDLGDDFDAPQALRDLPDGTYICFYG